MAFRFLRDGIPLLGCKLQFIALFQIHPVGRGIPDAPLIVLFTCGKSENCSNFRRTVQEAGPYGIVRHRNDKLKSE